MPARLVARYTENVAFAMNHLKNLIYPKKISPTGLLTETLGGQFGFKKVFLMLTEPGKLIAISSTDGTIIWKKYFSEDIP